MSWLGRGVVGFVRGVGRCIFLGVVEGEGRVRFGGVLGMGGGRDGDGVFFLRALGVFGVFGCGMFLFIFWVVLMHILNGMIEFF